MCILTFNKKTIISWVFFILLVITILSIIVISGNIDDRNSNLVSADIHSSNTYNSGVELQQRLNNLAKQQDKIAYLTFDDGPTLKATGKILDILQAENIKASFFVIGQYVEKHPELVKRAYESGHYISNHTYSHKNRKLYSSEDTFITEIKLTDNAIANAINVPNYTSTIFRFPNGYSASKYKIEKKQYASILNEMGYAYIDWNCLNKDSERKISHNKLLENLKQSSRNKGTLIILMHDTCDVNNTPDILLDSIKYLKSEGYEFHNFYDFVPKNF